MTCVHSEESDPALWTMLRVAPVCLQSFSGLLLKIDYLKERNCLVQIIMLIVPIKLNHVYHVNRPMDPWGSWTVKEIESKFNLVN